MREHAELPTSDVSGEILDLLDTRAALIEALADLRGNLWRYSYEYQDDNWDRREVEIAALLDILRGES